MNKKSKFKVYLFIIIVLFTSACSKKDSWRETLYTPTLIEKIDNLYFIVDCWHNRVIYNDNMKEKISNWKTLSQELEGPHSIASDKNVFLIDNTEKNEIQVFKRTDDKFTLTQTIKDVGKRPHKIIYDKNTNLFYSIASTSQEIVILENINGNVRIKQKTRLDFLESSYIRSIAIIEDRMYFLPGPDKVICTEYKNGKFNVISEYKLPKSLQAINHVYKVGNYYYISLYTMNKKSAEPKLVRFKSFEELKNNKYEDITKKLKIKGVPYFFSEFDGKIFFTEIDSYSEIKSFEVHNDKIENVVNHYDSGKPSKESIERKKSILK